MITPSEYLKKIVRGWGISPQKIRVIYNAVDLPELQITKEELRRKLGIKPQTFLMVSSGRNVPWKGFSLMKAVGDELKKDYPDMDLRIFHDLPRNSLLEYIKTADLYVLNTGYEGLSNTLVEVMMIGTPIITTNVCGNPEVIQNESSGLLVEYNNREQLKQAILKLHNHPELREKFSENGRRSLAKFSLENMINQTEGVLKSCAS